jgi:hypothetical protein
MENGGVLSAEGIADLRAHAEAMADTLEDLAWCDQTAEMIQRGQEVWQRYVDWAARIDCDGVAETP